MSLLLFAALLSEEESQELDFGFGVSLDITSPGLDGVLVFSAAVGLSLDENLPTLAYPPPIDFEFGVDLSLWREPKATGRRLVATDAFGTVHAELDNAEFGDLSLELNRWEDWSFSLPADDPKVGPLLAEKFREVQWWSGDDLVAWGPLVRPQVDNDTFTGGCHGALWHLSRRHVGPARRRNYIVNGDFEDGLSGWGFFTSQVAIHYGWDFAQADPPIHSIVRHPVLSGRRALRLENTVAGADAYAGQTFLFSVDDAEGAEFFLKGYVFVESFEAGAHTLGNGGPRGLFMQRVSTTQPNDDPLVLEVLPDAKKLLEVVNVPIDETTPRGEWVRFEVPLEVPFKSGEPETIGVRLYPPKGVVYWDAVGLFRDEALRFRSKDQGNVILPALVEHAQDPAYDKSDVNLTVVGTGPQTLRTRTYPFVERANIFDAITEFCDLDDGYDLSVTYTPTERRLTSHLEGKNRLVRRAALQLGRNIAWFSWAFDGENAATSVVTLGQGSTPAREEGWATDTSTFADGLTLETVVVASPETPIDSLDNKAKEILTAARTPDLLDAHTHPHQVRLLSLVRPGDSVPVLIRIYDGDDVVFEVDDIYRIARMRVVGTDETVVFMLNRRTP